MFLAKFSQSRISQIELWLTVGHFAASQGQSRGHYATANDRYTGADLAQRALAAKPISPTLRRWRALRRSHRFESALDLPRSTTTVTTRRCRFRRTPRKLFRQTPSRLASGREVGLAPQLRCERRDPTREQSEAAPSPRVPVLLASSHTAARDLHRRGEAGCNKNRRAREGCSRPPGWRNPASEVLLEPQADREPVWIADGVADGVVARLDLEGGGAGLRI